MTSKKNYDTALAIIKSGIAPALESKNENDPLISGAVQLVELIKNSSPQAELLLAINKRLPSQITPDTPSKSKILRAVSLLKTQHNNLYCEKSELQELVADLSNGLNELVTAVKVLDPKGYAQHQERYEELLTKAKSTASN